ncbi:13560_t:CDS:2, partial [Gigaspora rosea]
LFQDANWEIHKNEKKLEFLLLNENEQLGLKELIYLFEPFACATSLMGDPRFKDLEFASEKFKATKQSLKQKMRMLQDENESCQYLAIPTTSVLSEHLFSVARNVLTNKRNRLLLKYSIWQTYVLTSLQYVL